MSLISYLKQIFNTFIKDFLIGLDALQNSSINLLTIGYLILGWYLCDNLITTFLLMELITNINYIFNKGFTVKLMYNLLINKLISWWLIYSLYSQIIDIEYWYFGLLFSPIFLSWYLFNPYINASFTERMDYFICRYPFFFGFATIPSIVIILSYYLNYYYVIFILINVIINHKASNNPKRYMYIPYTSHTFNTDPICIFENLVKM